MAKNFVKKKGGVSYGLQNEDRRFCNPPGDLSDFGSSGEKF
jgi:hypothetical protein